MRLTKARYFCVVIYFASDFHLGIPNHAESLERERKLVRWLNQISTDATEVYLVGDLFDYWFEYRSVVPKGFVRLLGKLADMTDQGIQLHIFSGNHDVWMFDYFKKELGATVYHKPIVRKIGEVTIYIAHGDGLGPGDFGYKFIKYIFRNSVCQWLYKRIHPDFADRMARFFSYASRSKNYENDRKFLGEDKEWLLIHSKKISQQQKVNYFIYGHRHLPMEIAVGPDAVCLNLGDWITHFTYAVFDGKTVSLKTFETSDKQTI